MKVVSKIIDFYLNQLLVSRPSPELKITLKKLVCQLKFYGYPDIELVDIISIKIMLDYILSSPVLIRFHESFIRDAIDAIDDILGDRLYIKVEAEIIKLEHEFRKNICISTKQYDDRLFEEIKDIITNFQ